MKILMIYCTRFSYRPTIKTIDWVETIDESKVFEHIQLACIQIEEHDMKDETSAIKKLVNFIKWISRKNASNKIVLHSFAHLSESKADPAFTKVLFDKVELKLKNANFDCCQTPYGYFLDLEIVAPGFSLARVFKSF